MTRARPPAPADVMRANVMRSGLPRNGRMLAAIATRDPHQAGEFFAELQRRHERLKGAAMDVVGWLDFCGGPEGHASAGAIGHASKLREALYAEARE